MAFVSDSIPHTVRTANDPRQSGLYNAKLSHIEQVNSTIRLLRLSIDKNGPPFHHLPGQWLDVHIPSIPQAGGFTITSPPSTAISTGNNNDAYVELAIQKSPRNPPAAYLWRSPAEILHTWLQIRVGGLFVYPPLVLHPKQEEEGQNGSMREERISTAVFVAGGVGINPIMSMLSALDQSSSSSNSSRVATIKNSETGPKQVRVLYTSRCPDAAAAAVAGDKNSSEKVLFYDRIRALAEEKEKRRKKKKTCKSFKDTITTTTSTSSQAQTAEAENYLNTTNIMDLHFAMFRTRPGGQPPPAANPEDEPSSGGVVTHHSRRITHADLLQALGPVEERATAVAYVCGPPDMTDEFVDVLRRAEGMEERRVLCEKWW